MLQQKRRIFRLKNNRKCYKIEVIAMEKKENFELIAEITLKRHCKSLKKAELKKYWESIGATVN